MNTYVATNQATTTLAAPITAASTSVQLTGGAGSLFPALTGAQQFEATLIKAGTPTTREIVLCTARSGDTCTIVRGQGGTTALSWNAGDTFALLIMADAFNACVQTPQLQAQTCNYAIDTGSANAYQVTLTPALTAHITGMPIVWKAANTNTGNSTFNDGAGVGNLALSPGIFVPAGGIQAGGIYTSYWDGVQRFITHYAPNLTGYALNSSFASGSNGNGHWEKNLITGVISQWGSATGIPNAPGATVTFPIAFTNNVQVVISAYGGNATVTVLSQTLSSFQLINGIGGTCTWHAKGV